MKKLPLVLFLICMTSCVSTTPPAKEKASLQPPPAIAKEPLSIAVQTVEKLATEERKTTAPEYGELLSDVSVSASSFNPKAGQKMSISYTLSNKAEVKANIYDPDLALVRTLASDGSQAPGRHSFVWDGKDQNGVVVPDEAYFFTIWAYGPEGTKQAYDPTLFSGGEGRDITQADIDPISKAITYRLPVLSRVLVRLGVQDGPLLNTLVDWKPRVAGEITEHWDGRDKDDIIDLLNHRRFKMLITYFTLPDNSIITYGNTESGYRAYKKSIKAPRPVKERPARPGVVVSPHYQLPRTVDYSPNLEMTFPDVERNESGDTPVLKDRALTKVDIDEEDKSFFVNQQYEITFFLDTEFYTEQEVGYAPFNWVWDLSDVAEGEHILTVNMSGFKDQIGVLSKKIKIVK